jgi:hypothetical protein
MVVLDRAWISLSRQMKIIRRYDSDFLMARAVTDTYQVYDYIANLLVEKDEYDDGSYGPVIFVSPSTAVVLTTP